MKFLYKGIRKFKENFKLTKLNLFELFFSLEINNFKKQFKICLRAMKLNINIQ